MTCSQNRLCQTPRSPLVLRDRDRGDSTPPAASHRSENSPLDPLPSPGERVVAVRKRPHAMEMVGEDDHRHGLKRMLGPHTSQDFGQALYCARIGEDRSPAGCHHGEEVRRAGDAKPSVIRHRKTRIIAVISRAEDADPQIYDAVVRSSRGLVGCAALTHPTFRPRRRLVHDLAPRAPSSSRVRRRRLALL